MVAGIGNSLQRFVCVTATSISAEQLAFVANLFDTIQRPALVLALYDAERTAVAATIERLGAREAGGAEEQEALADREVQVDLGAPEACPG